MFLLNILAQLINGVSYGLVLFLVATGMSLTLGLMRVVNMSHGAIYMVSGYTGCWVYTLTQSKIAGMPDWVSWIIAILAGALLGGVLGGLLEVGFLRRLYKSPTYQVLLTIGIINILNNVAQWIWGGLPKSAPIPRVFQGAVIIGSIGVPKFKFVILAFGIILAVLLWLLQDKTKLGAMVRAGMDNREVAGTLGINNKLIFTGVFVLGSFVAGLSSLIGGTATGLNSGSTAWDVLLYSIIVVVVGGTGSIQGALLGGVIIGVVNSFGTAYFRTLSPFLVYIILIIVLLVKPAGLLGRKVDINKAIEGDLEKGNSPKRHKAVLPKAEMVLTGTKVSPKLFAYRAAPYAFALVILAILPVGLNTYMQSMMTKVLIYALFAMSLDIVMGFGGRRSFGHAAYFGAGGYIVGLLARHAGITNFWALLIFVLVLCALLSAIIGYLTLRLSGTYFLIVTMAFGQLLSVMAIQFKDWTGGSDGLSGIPKPNFGFFQIDWTKNSQTKMYYFVLLVVLICYVLLHCFTHSTYGRSLIGVRENEGRMRALGYNTWSTMYVAVIIAGVFAGIAGMLNAYAYNVMVPTLLDLTTSATPMLMVIMGGSATLWGPALASFVIIMFQTLTSGKFTDRWPLFLGLLYVVCVLFLRGGFAQYLTNFWNWVGSKLFPEYAEKKPEKAVNSNAGRS